MSAAPDLIRQLTRSGVRLEARGDRLHVEAPAGTVTPDLRALLVNRKADLLATLDTTGERGRLLALAHAECLDPDLIHRLPAADLAACEGVPDAAMRTYVRMLHETAERMAGRRLPGESAVILCRGCGPVWAFPDVAAMLPVVDGIPRSLGCPWCHARKAGKPIPRPRVACATCQHYQRDSVNPAGGIGTCAHGHGAHYPHARHACAGWWPGKETVASVSAADSSLRNGPSGTR